MRHRRKKKYVYIFINTAVRTVEPLIKRGFAFCLAQEVGST